MNSVAALVKFLVREKDVAVIHNEVTETRHRNWLVRGAHRMPPWSLPGTGVKSVNVTVSPNTDQLRIIEVGDGSVVV